jgi:hypothetical protein
MRKYEFEYFNQKYASRLALFLSLSFLLLLFSSLFILVLLSIKSQLLFLLMFILSIGIPFSIYLTQKNKIKKYGFALIYDSYLFINLDNSEQKIEYDNIRNFYIQRFDATLLYIVFIDGEKLKLSASSTYCDTVKFDEFCEALENKIEEYNLSNSEVIIRKKSFFEGAWFLPFLLVSTIAIIAMLIFALIKGSNIPLIKFLLVIAPLFTLWAGYLSTKKKVKH